MNKHSKIIKFICTCVTIFVLVMILYSCTGCDFAGFDSIINDVKGQLVGVAFDCEFYDNNGNKFMNVTGEKINMQSNTIMERTYSDGEFGVVETMSSVITITIDGSQVESCGSTILFIEEGLDVDVDFNVEAMKNIESDSDEFTDNTFIASIVNQYKNYFGKPTVVVIQSQLGDPICAFSGNVVYWEVCQDLPTTTKLMIDGKALYIHRANFQIIDKDLLK